MIEAQAGNPRKAWLVAVAGTALFVLLATLQLSRGGLVSPEVDLGPNATLLGFAMFVAVIVGSLIIGRTGSGRVGWLLVTLGLIGLVNDLSKEYAVIALIRDPGSLPLGREAAWLWDWFWVGVVALIPPLLLIFPNGRLLSRKWRVVLWADAVCVALFVLGAILFTWPERGVALLDPADVPVENPSALTEGMEAASIAFLMFALGGGALSLILRYRRADGIERHQLKWLASASVFQLLAILFAYIVFKGDYSVLNLLADLAVGTVPAA
ncbi:MAG TPA: hypothetical protein VHI31_06145, partial [Actinomycetota bacterium]|nr:hypothetical protein [Actinomycetota bacterium]